MEGFWVAVTHVLIMTANPARVQQEASPSPSLQSAWACEESDGVYM